jgi:hypothetical protein
LILGPCPREVPRPVGSPNPVGVGTVEADEVPVGLGDVNEDAGQKLEGVDERIVVVDGLPALGLIEQKLGVRMIPETREVDRRPHEVAGELVEALGIAGIDGGAVMNSETRVSPGEKKVDAVLGNELAVSEKS